MFYTELEDFLASHVETQPATIVEEPARKTVAVDPQDQRKSAAAMASLAEGIQALVAHMRQEQQQIRDWVEAQSAQQDDIGRLLRRLISEREKQI